MLAQNVVQSFGGKARFAIENYGGSELARRYGVTRYPAIFVDDILVATPYDFGFYGNDGTLLGGGRYSPLKTAASHDRFRGDLRRMIDLILAGRKEAARAEAAPAQPRELAAFPEVAITDLDGKPLTRAELAGKVVLVEVWATWCPPCRQALRRLVDLKKRHGDKVAVVTLAVESDAAGVKGVARELDGQALVWALGTPEVIRAFGDVGALPTLLVFDANGRAAATLYGAPPTLEADLEAKLKALLG